MSVLLPLVDEDSHESLRGVVMLDATLIVNATTMLTNCHHVITACTDCEESQEFLDDTARIVRQLHAVLFGQMIPFPIAVNGVCEHGE